MKRLVQLASLAALAMAAGWGTTGPVDKTPAERKDIAPYSTQTFQVTFEANKLARVICVGTGKTFMGVNVYDPQGNCVAFEPGLSPRGVHDDLIVEWVPGERTRYTIEVNNLGRTPNRFTLVVK